MHKIYFVFSWPICTKWTQRPSKTSSLFTLSTSGISSKKQKGGSITFVIFTSFVNDTVGLPFLIQDCKNKSYSFRSTSQPLRRYEYKVGSCCTSFGSVSVLCTSRDETSISNAILQNKLDHVKLSGIKPYMSTPRQILLFNIALSTTPRSACEYDSCFHVNRSKDPKHEVQCQPALENK